MIAPCALIVGTTALCNTYGNTHSMTVLRVRKTGNSLSLLVPKREAEALGLHEGDAVQVEIHKVRDILEFAGWLKGRATAEELNALTNEGEDLD